MARKQFIKQYTREEAEAFARRAAEIVKKRQLVFRDRYRETVCLGCRNNRYNFPSGGDGVNAPTSGEGCWHLDGIKRGKCALKG